MCRNGLITAIVVALVMTGSALAQDATVIDKKKVEVKLSKVTTTHIQVTREESGAVFKIPVGSLSGITRAGDGETLLFTLIDKKVVRGTTSDSLAGEWELGKYTISLSDVKSVNFHAQSSGAGTAPMADQPDGFVLTCTDTSGTSIEVYGASFNFAYRYQASGRWIPYPPTHTSENNSRQFLPMDIDDVTVSIPFTQIKSVELQPPTSKSYGAMPAARVTTTDAKIVSGKVAAYGELNRRFAGKTAFGDWSLDIGKVARVDFEHDKDKNPTTEYLDRDLGWGKKLDSRFTVRTTTWAGKEYVFTDACVFGLDDGHKWVGKSTSFSLKIGESQNTVGFSKIRAITFNTEGKLDGNLTTPTGTTVAISSISNSHIGGQTKEFGPAYLALKRVKKIEIVK